MCETNSEELLYMQLSSSVNPSFWNKFTELKLEVDKLAEVEHNIWGYFNIIFHSECNTTVLEVDSTSFNENFNGQTLHIPFQGKLINKNTIEQFKECNKLDLINELGQSVLEKIESETVLYDPSLLNSFLILSFVDLKKYHFYYWFAFPVPKSIIVQRTAFYSILEEFSESEVKIMQMLYNLLSDCFTEFSTSSKLCWNEPVDFSLIAHFTFTCILCNADNVIWEKRLNNYLSENKKSRQVEVIYNEFKKLGDRQKTYFLLEKTESDIKLHYLKSNLKKINMENKTQFYFVFYNIATTNSVAGSQLKNYIIMLLHYCPFLQGQNASFIAFSLNRKDDFSVTCNQSTIYKLKLPFREDKYTWVGWEKNERGKMGPRMANMKNTLDPYVIAENSIDLNLKLMKWRVLPDINLEKIKDTKCLILGSGTLGCSVARTLLAWGVRTITFVDNSTVSFSNPVRQSLYTYLDSVQMKPKALAAADNLKTIFPGVKSEGIQLSIPMPGHTIGESLLEQTKENVNKLKELIEQHDLIFLLMDSRESRWLPTFLANGCNKITINAALGFDTYLVMRHGIRGENNVTPKPLNHPEGFKYIMGTELGCYFCNDVTAPGNSMKDRTLDQQCTVTRPGVSQVAGALAVELAVSILQHKDGAAAPAYYTSSQNYTIEDSDLDNESLLGIIPHSIRGFLSSFQHILPATEKYKHCVACSDIVLNEYNKNGMEFLLKVFNSSKHLEDVTQLTEMFKEIDLEDVLEFSDEDF